MTTNGARLARRFAPVITVGMFTAALWVLHRELARYRYHDVLQALHALSPRAVLISLVVTAVGYLVLTVYDVLALRYVQRRLDLLKTTFTSFIAYAFAQLLGLHWLTGGSIRYRLYSPWGLSPVEIAKIVVFSSLTFWLGVLAIGGAVLTFAPLPALEFIGVPPAALRALGATLLVLVATYLAISLVRRRPIRLREWEIAVPAPRLAFLQVALGALDWALAGAVLYVLLPPAVRISLFAFLGIFLLGHLVGLVSQVPGGLGVFETVVILSLKGQVPASALLASLVVYRAVYYLLPFMAATTLLAGYEIVQRKAVVGRMARVVGQVAPPLVPWVLAGTTFLAGVVLLISGATPAVGSRLAWLGEVLPLELIEISHFLGSVLGVGLLILAWGLQRRIDAAYHLAAVFLALGIAASLLKGGDWEEAVILTALLAMLLPARRHFYRAASLTTEPLTPSWIAAVGLVLIAVGWLGLFAYQHVAFSTDLWWQFALHGNAPRFLRASVGVLVTVAAFAALRLIRPAPPDPPLPGPAELLKARRVIASDHSAGANVALVGDKALLFDETETAFIMYGISGRSWVALGDPIGSPERRADLIWHFRELVDRHSAWTVFYQVAPDQLPLYLDLGLTALKIGEEARVSLSSFTLEGGHRKTLRRARRLVETSGCSFTVVPADQVSGLIPDLRAISDAWLAEKKTREKGFSLGRFTPEYIANFPVGIVRRESEILAFANLWPSGDRSELSVDLMRYKPEAPPGVMDYLFTELMLWGQAEGYQYFDLGMAPLSGLENRKLAPLWNRVSALLFRHGEHFYNFQGLRSYKEKFDPEWEPQYLASPGGWVLPRILADVAVLISGGIKGVVGR